MSAGDITARVQRGTDLLDEKRPGWWREIDLGHLDIDSKCGCILGQIGNADIGRPLTYPGYGIGLAIVNLNRDQASECGFDADTACLDFDAEYDALTEAWRDLITARREPAGVTG